MASELYGEPPGVPMYPYCPECGGPVSSVEVESEHTGTVHEEFWCEECQIDLEESDCDWVY